MGKKSGFIQVRHQDGGKHQYYKCGNCGFSSTPVGAAAANYACPRCGTYFRMQPQQRIDLIADDKSFQELYQDVLGADPLEFSGYGEKLQAAQDSSGSNEAVTCGMARVGGIPCGLAVMDAAFMMGSMGYAVGERIARLFDEATRQGVAVVVFCASGGARMQEGLVSLMQMAKVSCAVERHHQEGLLFVSVLTDPTTGGVTASFGMQGDVILAEPKALIGFAGRRVIESTVGQKLPDDFQTAEFALEHGLIDGIVARQDLRQVIAQLLFVHKGEERILGLLDRLSDARSGRRSVDFLHRRRDAFSRRDQRKTLRAQLKAFSKRAKDDNYAQAQTPLPPQDNLQKIMAQEEKNASKAGIDVTAWKKVQLARRTDRPTARTYLQTMVDCFMQMHGDRAFADDPAIVAGLGFINGRAVTIITQEKGTSTSSRLAHNFGCAHPEGYRKAARLAKAAEAFGRPVVCLVDTQGAHCDMASEERGQGNALALCLQTFAGLRVPVVSVILSEGGSGGALALALGDKVAMMENAIYSILTPEGFASILWKDARRAPEAACAMRLTAQDVLAMGIIDDIIPEEAEGAHQHPRQAAQAVKDYVSSALDELCQVPVDELVARRQARFNAIR